MVRVLIYLDVIEPTLLQHSADAMGGLERFTPPGQRELLLKPVEQQAVGEHIEESELGAKTTVPHFRPRNPEGMERRPHDSIWLQNPSYLCQALSQKRIWQRHPGDDH